MRFVLSYLDNFIPCPDAVPSILSKSTSSLLRWPPRCVDGDVCLSRIPFTCPHHGVLRCVLTADEQSVSAPSASSDPSAAPPGWSSRSKLQVDQRDKVWGPAFVHTIPLLLYTSVRLQYGALYCPAC